MMFQASRWTVFATCLAVTCAVLLGSGCIRRAPQANPDMPESERELRRYVERNPYDSAGYYRLADYLFAQSRLEEAADQYALAINLNPSFFEAHARLGTTFLLLDKPYEALTSLQDAASLDSDSITVKNNLAYAYMRVSEYEKARDIYQQVLQLDPENLVALLNLGVIHRYHVKDFDKAADYYTKYLELEPESEQRLAILEWLNEQKRIKGTLPGAPESSDMNEQERRMLAIKYYNEGMDAYTAGRTEDAYRQWTQAVSVDPWHPEANYRLSLMYCMQARSSLESALERIEKALVIEPENEEYQALKRRIEEIDIDSIAE